MKIVVPGADFAARLSHRTGGLALCLTALCAVGPWAAAWAQPATVAPDLNPPVQTASLQSSAFPSNTTRFEVDGGPVYVPVPVQGMVDEAFVAARKAMLDNDLAGVDKAIAVIPASHPLRQYADYWRLRVLLGPKRPEALIGTADAEVRRFIDRQPDTIAADLLRRDWLLALGRRGEWSTFDTLYPTWRLRDESAPACYASLSVLARLTDGKPLPAADAKAAKALVQQPITLNRPCASLFDALASGGYLKPADIRERLHLALEANAAADIRQAGLLLVPGVSDKMLNQVLNQPATALKGKLARELRLIALVRLARSDPAAAAAEMPRAGSALPAADRRFVWAQIGASGMRRLLPQANDWARQGVAAEISDDTRIWLIRAALREQDWPHVRQNILKLDETTRGDPAWVYWLGRERRESGHTADSKTLFKSIADRHDFYGKLAREELGLTILPPERPPAPPPERVRAWDADPGVARALAFYNLGMRFEGNREWNFAMRGRPSEDLRAAAVWARDRRILDRAINTDERVVDAPDFTVRFPAPFSAQLLPTAQAQNVDPAWVYGLIRQESRFIMDARSHVGASGLMQLMPATARWVAKQLGRSNYSNQDINDLQTNLEFGTYYLRRALDDLDGSAVLASAGYNAGPNRARNWRASLSRPIEGAIFAEIIPFTETRGYVKSVLSNATDYAALFSGEGQSLKDRLGVIAPKAATPTVLP